MSFQEDEGRAMILTDDMRLKTKRIRGGRGKSLQPAVLDRRFA